MFYMFYVCFLMYFFSNLYLYNTVLSVLFCVNKDIIIINDRQKIYTKKMVEIKEQR